MAKAWRGRLPSHRRGTNETRIATDGQASGRLQRDEETVWPLHVHPRREVEDEHAVRMIFAAPEVMAEKNEVSVDTIDVRIEVENNGAFRHP